MTPRRSVSPSRKVDATACTRPLTAIAMGAPSLTGPVTVPVTRLGTLELPGFTEENSSGEASRNSAGRSRRP